MASEGKFDTPVASPDAKATGATPAGATAPAAASGGAALAFDVAHLSAEAKEADVADGEIMVNDDPRAVAIVQGFGIKYMTMKDAVTRQMMWQTEEWGKEMFDSEIDAHIPASILGCAAVAREVCFSSKEKMDNFKMTQRVLVFGKCTEEWTFKFGFVIPGSTNTWEQTIVAAPKARMLPASLLSGNLVVETTFTDGELLVAKTLVRIWYDEEDTGEPALSPKKADAAAKK